MEKPNALEFFRGKVRYNCAQAVLKAYAPVTGADESCLERFAQFGGGRAPDGECGAVFAAKSLLEDADARKAVERDFVTLTGTMRCRDIRTGRRASCEQCVQTAADALYSQLSKSMPLRRPLLCTN